MLCSHCGIAPMSISVIDTLSRMLLCDLSCQSPFFLCCLLTWFCPEGLIALPFLPVNLTTSLKPICVQHELSFLSSAPPLHKTTTICPLNVFHPSYRPSWDMTKKQTVTGMFLTLSLPVFTHSSYTHTPATSSYTVQARNSLKLFEFIVTEQNTRSSGALMHCQLLYVLPKLLHLVPQELLHTIITRFSVPGGCLCKSSFP